MTQEVKGYWLGSIAIFVASCISFFAWNSKAMPMPGRIVLWILAVAFYIACRSVIVSWKRRTKSTPKLDKQR
jgi:hypothetical protein